MAGKHAYRKYEEVLILTLEFCRFEEHMVSEMDWITTYEREQPLLDKLVKSGCVTYKIKSGGQRVPLYSVTPKGDLLLRLCKLSR